MPVKIDGITFEDHNKAVAHLKKSKPEIKDPDAYVATVERSMKGAKAQRLYARLDNVMEAMDLDKRRLDEHITRGPPDEETEDKTDTPEAREYFKKEAEEYEKKKQLKARLQKLAGYDDTCPNCGSKNVTKNTVGERTCNNCGLSPTRKGDKSKTAGEKTWTCSECGEKFTNSGDAFKHTGDANTKNPNEHHQVPVFGD